MLLLSETDIQKLLTMEEAIDVMEQAFLKYSQRDYVMPPRTFIEVDKEDQLLSMPCLVDDCIGFKVVTSFPSNRTRTSPVTQGLVFIYDRETGTPLTVMNGTSLTAIKTGAVSGVSMRYFKKEAESIGLVGTGLQGLYQLIAALSATTAKKIYLYNRSQEKIEEFIQTFRSLTTKEPEIVVVTDVRELIEESEIIITATTSLTPVLPDEPLIYRGKLIVAVGAYKDNMREIPKSLFTDAEYYFIDSEQGKVECGDIIDPLANGWVAERQVISLSDIVSKKKQIEFNRDNRPILFKSVSMALFDAVIGNYIYKKAKEIGLGTEFDLE